MKFNLYRRGITIEPVWFEEEGIFIRMTSGEERSMPLGWFPRLFNAFQFFTYSKQTNKLRIHMLLAVIYLIMGTMFVIMSLVTWKFKRLGIIAGYDEKKILNKKGLAAWFGKCSLGLAACALVLSMVCFYMRPFDDSTAFIFGLSFTVIIMIGTVVTLSGMSKFYKF
ncbi:DUF3784 domain-containing protein [Dyadobacter fermentans]|uniref:DUF3784 domain-containing protein n=1 Tax=Dyadobacter fermentans TaxID=94254 RepID=UPI001CC15D10|nr:DUF3784 domain-containing protein [Dyadobacter fermentans]MBZ1362709.1 DUF3784 domain-containing protein [Dyadobacter fermentans]